jgi:hypothetical protein
MSSKTITSLRGIRPAKIHLYDDQAFGNSNIISSGPVSIMSITALNKGTLLYLMLFDATAVPSNGAVPYFQPIALVAGAQVTRSFNEVSGEGLLGLDTQVGLAWAASTTPATLTIDATSSVWTSVGYTS